MSFNAVNQYTGNHKSWDHIGNVLPNMEYGEGIRPHFDSMPAAWLPVSFWEKHYENWVVCTAGKLISVDPQGRVVPAQYMLASSTVTYTTNDVTAQTIDVRNGNACTSASVSASPITLSGVTAWMGVTSQTWAAKAPIGAASYAFLQWAGDGSSDDDGSNPAAFRFHNYNMQHRVAATCDYMLQLPVVPAPTATESLTVTSNTGAVTIFSALSNLPVAANTTLRTPIAFANGTATDVATRFVNQVDTVAEVLSAGDWHINLTSGVITVHSTTTLASGNYTCSYYNYASAASTVSVFASVLGNPQPGDFLKCDSNSNWVVATPHVFGTSYTGGAAHNFDDFSHIMGQVLGVHTYPNSLLDRVRTAYPSLGTSGTGALPGSDGQMDQMPGSANGGVPSSIHYSGAANLAAVVNMVSR
jgi:hypothetical protein